ncbi:MAG: GNAT family N-acetyltransferase [Gammaproteobacteria bacterium]|nr:GNAT family N-acetyltransferase [Gammaproteobacteria bacterium]MDH5274168.1 GNAT family N-acetyltransferase [Gammaproteobacteria bacterium]
MSSVSWPTAATSTAARIEIVPIGRQHIAGFHAALDCVAKERRYLALLEAPSLWRTRRFVLASLQAGAVHVVAVAADRVVGWCDLRPKAAPALRHTAVLGMGVVAAFRSQGIGSRLLTAALGLAPARGIRRSELVVRSDNSAAIALYRRFGFVDEGTCRSYMRVDGADYDALLMARLDPGVSS